MSSSGKPPRFGRAAGAGALRRVAAALEAANMDAVVVPTLDQARDAVLDRIPEGAEVLTATSRTLEACGLVEILERSGRYRALRPVYLAMDRATQAAEIRRMRASPAFVVGSVHAVTEGGELLVASQTGSQLASYAYGAGRVILVVGAQKVVRDVAEGLRRIHEHSFPLEDRRSREAYGTPSGVNKVLVLAREARPGRTSVILVEREVGF